MTKRHWQIQRHEQHNMTKKKSDKQKQYERTTSYLIQCFNKPYLEVNTLSIPVLE